MNSDFLFEMRINLTKRFPPKTRDVNFGRYNLIPIPTDTNNNGEAIVSFINTYKHIEGDGSHPEEEARNVCRLLSLILNTRIKQSGIRINSIDIPNTSKTTSYPQFFGNLELSELDKYFHKIFYLNNDLARQFLRACHTYSFAIDFIPSDVTFAFFLLVVSVECLSSQDAVIPKSLLDIDSRKCERFCHFIKNFLPPESKSKDEKNEKLFTKLLKTIYYSHRSGFAHGGKEVSAASIMADSVKSSYFNHATNGKEVKTPGIGWYSGIVRRSLLGYLDAVPSKEEDQTDKQLLAKIAYEKAYLKMKAKKAVEKNQVVVPSKDVDFR